MLWKVLRSACVCVIPAFCFAADPAKDPGGWADVKFGMSPDQVLASLGPDGYVLATSPAEAARPFGLDETTDVPAAVAFAKDKVARAKKDSDSVPDELLAPCEKLLKEMKSFSWVSRAANNPLTPPTEMNEPPRRISGTLESITSWGAKGTIAYRRTLQIKTARAIVPVSEVLLDPDSKKELARIENAIEDIASAMRRVDELADRKIGTDEKQPTPASRVRSHPVKIRGIALHPDFTFDGEKLSKIYLGAEYAKNGGAGFDEHGMQETLVDALEEKYGRHDERNRADGGVEYLWRFPGTVVRCVAGQRTYPGRAFVRKWVSITYEQPSAANAPAQDKL
jgi:hypothetical protein